MGLYDCEKKTGLYDCEKKMGLYDCEKKMGLYDCETEMGLYNCEKKTGLYDCEKKMGLYDCEKNWSREEMVECPLSEKSRQKNTEDENVAVSSYRGVLRRNRRSNDWCLLSLKSLQKNIEDEIDVQLEEFLYWNDLKEDQRLINISLLYISGWKKNWTESIAGKIHWGCCHLYWS